MSITFNNLNYIKYIPDNVKLGFKKQIINDGLLSYQPDDVFPLDLTGTSRNAYLLQSNYDFVYNRIHFYIRDAINLPNPFNYQVSFGNVAADTQLLYVVWNTIKETATYDETLFQGQTDNVTFSLDLTTLKQNQKTIARFTADKDGDAVIDGSVSAAWDIYTNILPISGFRILIMQFMPQAAYNETYQYLTNVIDTYNGEQRVSLRDEPLIIMSYEYLLKRDTLRTFYNKFRERTTLLMGVPYFSDYVFLESVFIGATEIQLPVSATFNILTGNWIIYKSDEDYEILNQLDFVNNKILLSVGVSQTWENVIICPIMFANVLSNINSEGNFDLDRIKMNYTLESDFITNGSYSPTEYENHPLYLENNFTFGSFKREINQDIDLFSTSSKSYHIEENRAYKTDTFSLGFISNKSEIDNLRKQLDYYKGRWKAFWLPTHHHDFILSENLQLNSDQINFDLAEESEVTNQHIIIFYKDGDYEIHKISSVVAGVASLDDSLIGRNASIDDVQYICRLHLVRFHQDDFTIKFKNLNHITLETSVKLLVDEEIDI